ncbi:Aste57867_12731 [Aphanomyces stellatus]|uniref:Aste57867_12731 protein n=1 Tax=Aphanomyces stellatus TaxID=120398 RepID=A0A485KWC1_9STRA|nr:hypothetical protein As57867_012683 [Aphanomyces stellatus]VFT89581.1 Aste57867_12731 [Aphanomyces stellatus]
MAASLSAEDREMKDMVAKTLEAQGVLGQIKAQLRAAVYKAMHHDTSVDDNRVRKELHATKETALALTLVIDFLRHFNLQQTLSVLAVEASLDDVVELVKARQDTAAALGLSLSDAPSALLTEWITSGKGASQSSSRESAHIHGNDTKEQPVATINTGKSRTEPSNANVEPVKRSVLSSLFRLNEEPTTAEEKATKPEMDQSSKAAPKAAEKNDAKRESEWKKRTEEAKTVDVVKKTFDDEDDDVEEDVEESVASMDEHSYSMDHASPEKPSQTEIPAKDKLLPPKAESLPPLGTTKYPSVVSDASRRVDNDDDQEEEEDEPSSLSEKQAQDEAERLRALDAKLKAMEAEDATGTLKQLKASLQHELDAKSDDDHYGSDFEEDFEEDIPSDVEEGSSEAQQDDERGGFKPAASDKPVASQAELDAYDYVEDVVRP